MPILYMLGKGGISVLQTAIFLIEHLLSIIQTQYNKFYMKISVSEWSFSDSSLNSPALSFKSIRYSSI